MYRSPSRPLQEMNSGVFIKRCRDRLEKVKHPPLKWLTGAVGQYCDGPGSCAAHYWTRCTCIKVQDLWKNICKVTKVFNLKTLQSSVPETREACCAFVWNLDVGFSVSGDAIRKRNAGFQLRYLEELLGFRPIWLCPVSTWSKSYNGGIRLV